MHYIKSCPVPVFYDTNEPPQLPMLSSQLEMYYRLKTRMCVSAMEEMSLSHPLTAVPATNTKPTTKTLCMGTPRTSLRATTPRAVTPVPKSSGKVAEKSVTIIEDQSLDSPSSSESSLSSWDEDESDRKKIPKPNGEVGRPGCGGYNLEDQLGWGKDGFKKLKALETVSKVAIAEFPDLDDFEDCWPVQDLVQLQLKYLSFKARQQKRARTTPPGEVMRTNTMGRSRSR
ncbi:hypothetical protein BKA83DRAFT_18549 [Pisolithus microcarpus]|nr:hypothetical protein BKA83DRAFT_18549 [Pisolithus microcarpus]